MGAFEGEYIGKENGFDVYDIGSSAGVPAVLKVLSDDMSDRAHAFLNGISPESVRQSVDLAHYIQDRGSASPFQVPSVGIIENVTIETDEEMRRVAFAVHQALIAGTEPLTEATLTDKTPGDTRASLIRDRLFATLVYSSRLMNRRVEGVSGGWAIPFLDTSNIETFRQFSASHHGGVRVDNFEVDDNGQLYLTHPIFGAVYPNIKGACSFLGYLQIDLLQRLIWNKSQERYKRRMYSFRDFLQREKRIEQTAALCLMQ